MAERIVIKLNPRKTIILNINPFFDFFTPEPASNSRSQSSSISIIIS